VIAMQSVLLKCAILEYNYWWLCSWVYGSTISGTDLHCTWLQLVWPHHYWQCTRLQWDWLV